MSYTVDGVTADRKPHHAAAVLSAGRASSARAPGGPVLWQNDLCRVVRVDEPDYPGFCRVILKRHAREMTDLDAGRARRR